MKKLLLSAAIFLGLVGTAAAQFQVPAGRWPIGRGGTTSGFYPGEGPFIDVTAPPYNAKLDGVTDDTVAIKAAIAAAVDKGKKVWLPCINNNVAIISDTLVIGSGVHLHTCDGGNNQTWLPETRTGVMLKWTGAANLPMVKFTKAHHSSLRGFVLDCNSGVATDSNGCIGVQIISDNNPTVHYLDLDNFAVINANKALVIGDPTDNPPPIPIDPPGTLIPVCGPAPPNPPWPFSQSNCAQADSLTINRFMVRGNGFDTTSKAIHVNDANGLQSSRLYQGNWQFVSVGLDLIWNGGVWTMDNFNGGNPIGERTFIKVRQYLTNPPLFINNETEGNYAYAVRDLSDTGDGANANYRYSMVMQSNQWNNPVSCEGNGRWLSIGNNGGGPPVNEWLAGGYCTVISLLEPTLNGSTRLSPWVSGGTYTQSNFTSVSADNATSKFTFASGDPLASDLRVNQILVFSDLATVANNNVYYKITAIGGTSNREITVTPAPTTMGADTSFSVQTLGKVSAWGVLAGQTGFQADNIFAGPIPSGVSIGFGNLTSSISATQGKLTFGYDGTSYLQRLGQAWWLTGASLGAGAVPASTSPGDLFTSRSTTAGALFFGSDSAKYFFRNGNDFTWNGAPLKILANQAAVNTPVSGTTLHNIGTNATAGGVETSGYGAPTYYTTSTSGGTASSQSALGSAVEMGGLRWYGWSGAVQSPGANIIATTTEAWNAGALGTKININTVSTGGFALVSRLEISGAGIFTAGATGGAQGNGTINTTGLYINGVSVGSAASMTSNTVLGNATGSTAAPTNLAVPSCSTASSALTYTTSGGPTAWGCNTLAALGVIQTFSAAQTFTSTVQLGTSTPLINSSPLGVAGSITQSGASGVGHIFNVTGAAADQRVWDIFCSSASCSLRAVNDAYSAAQSAWTAFRGSGATVASVNIGQGVFTVTDATDTTTTSTGSLRTAGGIAAAKAITAGTGIRLASTLMVSSTAPTIASGFCTSPTVPNANGTAAFTVNVGTGCAGSSGVITMPTAATGWVCSAINITNPATNVVAQSAGTTTSVTLTNYVRTTGVAGNFTASDVLRLQCTAY